MSFVAASGPHAGQVEIEGDLVIKRDPAEYIRKMRFHRAIVSPQEYGLS